MKNFNQVKALFAGLLLGSSVVPAVMADDIEIYTTLSGSYTQTNPNIMFVVDTSYSMFTTSEVDVPYDYTVTYDPVDAGDVSIEGECQSDEIYFSNTGQKPDCATSPNHFKEANLVCLHALYGVNYDGTLITPLQPGSLKSVGKYADQMARFDAVNSRWHQLDSDTGSSIVECLSDSGVDGDGPKSLYIADGVKSGYTVTVPTDPEAPHQVWENGEGHMVLYHGNYLNYLLHQKVQQVSKSYIDQVKRAVEIMVRGNTQVDIGLMRFDRDAIGGDLNDAPDGGSGDSEGGPVLYPILDVGADRNDFFTRLAGLDADGYTPLSETYYEALLYFGGKVADYGVTSSPSNQIGTTHLDTGTQIYDSPITGVCDRNYIVVLTDGAPSKDDLSEVRKKVLAGFNVASCSNPDDAVDDYEENCLDDLAGWAATHDVAVDPSIAAHEGDQHIITHTIGFKTEGNELAEQLLTDTAKKGDGDFFSASSESELVDVFDDIISRILKVNSTFASPAVSVNAFNRSTHLNDLYFTLFKPGEGNHWDGNLKKYKLEFAVDTQDKDGDGDTTEILPFIADQNHAPAVDPETGFFSNGAQSFWTPAGLIDGQEVTQGGAVSALTTGRKVYTLTGGYTSTNGVNKPDTPALKVAANRMHLDNITNLTDALLATTGLADIVTGTPYRTTLINWASGLDALSEYGGVDTDVRPQMGEPLHAEPALVQYGGTPDAPELVAYVATNDGYLHAFDVSNGTELFSFIPQELLPNLGIAMENQGGNKLYGLDGNVVAWINDADNDGTIEPDANEHVYIYVTMRRGGNNIYALDVSIKDAPELMWVIKGGETGDYTELGQTWSTINVEKIKDAGVEKTVLIFGGGYDAAQDAASVTSEDSVGHTVYIADAASGARLWAADQDTDTVTMKFSVPARVKPLDISGDGFIDRLYVADMGGQIFRFDIDNTDDARSLVNSITGGLIADLADASTAVPADRVAAKARRFYYPPDVALIDAADGIYHALVISSGYRAHPLKDDIQDRIYMLKDRNTGLMTTGYATLTEADLHNATANIAGGDGANDDARGVELDNIAAAEGWYIYLNNEDDGSWVGEKGLAEALIIEGVAIVTTYTPNLEPPENSCVPNIGLGKVFFLDMLDATAAFPSSLDSRGDRHIELVRGGIPPTPNVIITPDGVPTLCIGTECQKAELGLGVRKTYWYEVN